MRVFDKSVELWNYGLLPEELTPADLMKKHASYPRNRNIASVFYKAGFIESWGRGYKKIREEFEKAGHPVPTVEESGGGVLVTIQRRTVEDIIASREESGAVNGGLNGAKENDINNCKSNYIKDCRETGVDANVGVNNIKAMNFSRRQIIIKEIINQNPMITAKQMSETLSVTKRTIERDLSILQKAGIIRHEGSDKSGIWVVLEPYNKGK